MKVHKHVASSTGVSKSATKKKYIYIGGNAKFAGWDSHLIKHTRKE